MLYVSLIISVNHTTFSHHFGFNVVPYKGGGVAATSLRLLKERHTTGLVGLRHVCGDSQAPYSHSCRGAVLGGPEPLALRAGFDGIWLL